MSRLLIISSSTIHVYNYIELVKDYFEEILFITDKIKIESTIKTIELDFSFKKATTYFKTPKRIREITKNFNPTVVHIHQIGIYSYISLKAIRNLSIKTVVTAWGSDVLLTPQKNWLFKKIAVYSINKADYLTSDSKYMADRMRVLSGKKDLRILIANFGIKIQNISVNKEDVIYSNRLHKTLYRIDKIILAFDKFLKTEKGKNWKLIIGATGSETEKLVQLTNDLKIQDHVQFCGWVDSKVNIENYSKAKIFISIPESDATSISLLEAMAYGCLPIVSDLPANREWITPNENGIIVKNYDEDFISKYFEIDHAKMKMINDRLIQEQATVEVNKRKFIDMYNQLR